MSFYSELASDVDELIAEFGQPCKVTNYEMGIQDPATGIVSQPSSTFDTIGVLLDYDYRNFGDSTVSYQTVSASDKRVLLSAAKVINTGDLVYIDNTLYRCHVIKCVNPGGTRVLYDIWVQK